ncbi:MAG: hypothetical protein AB1650_04865 [Candidatus Omnitrophota bacterium]
MSCKNQGEHASHICQMKINQKFDEVKKLSKEATHFCENCEAPTNNTACVCSPKIYSGKPGILKWKK